jgi:hypothetical protein
MLDRALPSACIAAVLLVGCGGGSNTTTHGSNTWSVTVANNIGGPGKVAEAYAIARTHTHRGPEYIAADVGCFKGATGSELQPGGYEGQVQDPDLLAIYRQAVQDCGGK